MCRTVNGSVHDRRCSHYMIRHNDSAVTRQRRYGNTDTPVGAFGATPPGAGANGVPAS
jgi:hypothetical protein